MERYVWELVRAQEELGHDVSVLCELCHEKVDANIEVHELGRGLRKPRWLSALLFMQRTSQWLEKHTHSDHIIHSHEATTAHHIITFHGPPFARIRQFPWWKQISLRVQANLWIEKQLLFSPKVHCVTPNSELIANELLLAYPDITSRLTNSVIPGVVEGEVRLDQKISPTGGIIGFIGKEWHRKGLDRAISIIEELRKVRPDCELWVAGPEPAKISHLFKDWEDGYRLLGLTDARDIIPQLDLLLHPARREPFGMVITEALASQVPAVVSEQCGAASEVGEDQGKVIGEGSIELWAKACNEFLSRKTNPPPYQHSWQDVAKAYIDIYKSIQMN